MNTSKTVSRQGSLKRNFLIFFVFLIIGLAGVLVYVRSGKPQRDFIRENLATISILDSATEALGSPIELGQPVAARNGKQITVTTPASGPIAKGTLVFTGSLTDTGWVKDNMFIEVDGQQVDLETLDDILDLEISEGE